MEASTSLNRTDETSRRDGLGRAGARRIDRRRATTAALSTRAPKVSVVIPALNEARNIEHVLRRVPDEVHEVVLVDGRSTDDTVVVSRQVRPDIRVIHQTRRGKGNALACGFHACRGDIIVMLDADGSTDPVEIPRFVAALLDGAHFAKGSRFAPGGGSDDITQLRSWGNLALNRLVNRVYSTDSTDLCYGYNAFWSACLPHLAVSEPGIEVTDDGGPPPPAPSDEIRWGDGFEVETLLAVRIALLGLEVTEVPSYELPRLHGRSNLNAVRDGWRVLRTIAAERRRLQPLLAGAPPLPRPWEVHRRRADDVIDLTTIEPPRIPVATLSGSLLPTTAVGRVAGGGMAP